MRIGRRKGAWGKEMKRDETEWEREQARVWEESANCRKTWGRGRHGGRGQCGMVVAHGLGASCVGSGAPPLGSLLPWATYLAYRGGIPHLCKGCVNGTYFSELP